MVGGEISFHGPISPRWVANPKWGRQHEGHPPGGPQDQLSYALVNAVLGQENTGCLELMFPPYELHFSAAGWMSLAGADHDLRLDGREVLKGSVIQVLQGSKLQVMPKGLGARLYLQIYGGIIEEDGRFSYSTNQLRPKEILFDDPDWLPEEGVVRVIPGPENKGLENQNLDSVWKISHESDSRGLRLEGPVIGSNWKCRGSENMHSGPVFDGTIQLSPSGPIVLLRDRQCVGGYPRVWQVIACDVDRLAQFLPGQLLRFKEISLAEAIILEGKRSSVLGF